MTTLELEAEDDLAPAYGFLLGFLAGGLFWAIVLGALS